MNDLGLNMIPGFNLTGVRACLLLFAFAFLLSCKKEEPIVKEDNIYFKGITAKDDNGVPISNDSTDWNIKDSWMDKEKNLFSKHYKTDCQPGFDYLIDLYPNPNNGIFSLYLKMPNDARLDLRMVDRSYNLLFSKDSIEVNLISFNLENLVLKDTVRMYYKFVNAGCEYRGHGDIVFN